MADNTDAAAPAPVFTPEQCEAIGQWFVEEFHGHPDMRDTGAFNHIRAAVDRLKQRLEEN